MTDLQKLQQLLSAFAQEREWEQFHSPKNLSMALAIEASELMELFLWETTETSFQVKEHSENALKEELADVFLYLLRLADIVGIDLIAAALEKLQINAAKYPVAASKGTSKKYNQLSP